MKVVILCGGKGTRLREYTEKTPKPLVEVGGRPILWHLMKYYAHFGFDDFILCTGYLKERFGEYMAGPGVGFRAQCVDTGVESSKSERLKMIQPLIPQGEDFFVAYGDDLADVPLPSVLDFHKTHGKIATLTAVQLRSQYGILDLHETAVKGFIEKPVLDHWINGGFFTFRYELFAHLGQGELESQVLPALAGRGEVRAYPHKGFWKSMNTFQDVIELNELYTKGQASWYVWDPSYAAAVLAR